MWVFYALFPSLLVLIILVGGIVLLVRRGSEGWSIQFSGVLLGYVAAAMLVGVFLLAAGAGLLLRAGFAQAGERDFSYNVQPYSVYQPVPAPVSGPAGSNSPGSSQLVDPSDNAIRNDVAAGISLVFVGAVLFAVHAFGSSVLRRREAQGVQLTTRAYNLVGLAVVTLGFMGTGAQALNDLVRRYVVGGDTVQVWEIRHPGQPLAVAVVLLPLVLWFGFRVWQEMGGAAASSRPAVAQAAIVDTAVGARL